MLGLVSSANQYKCMDQHVPPIVPKILIEEKKNSSYKHLKAYGAINMQKYYSKTKNSKY